MSPGLPFSFRKCRAQIRSRSDCHGVVSHAVANQCCAPSANSDQPSPHLSNPRPPSGIAIHAGCYTSAAGPLARLGRRFPHLGNPHSIIGAAAVFDICSGLDLSFLAGAFPDRLPASQQVPELREHPSGTTTSKLPCSLIILLSGQDHL